MMQPYTFTTWEQVEKWVRENGLVKWSFSAMRFEDADRDEPGKRNNLFVCNSDWYEGDLEHKLGMTKNQLMAQPNRYLYGRGYHAANGSQGAASCEVCIGGQAMMQGVQGIGNQYAMMQPMVHPIQQPVGTTETPEAMEERITERITTRFMKEQLERDRKQLEDERAEFRKNQEGVFGLLIEKLAPVAQAFMQNAGHQRIGALDVTHDTPEEHAPEAQEQEEQSVFTAEEEAELYDLLARFKAVEPDNWLRMIRSVVTMAEANDSMYNMAKGVLCK